MTACGSTRTLSPSPWAAAQMSNPGRYLTLLPPIDGAWAASGTPYFTESPGQTAHMWDSTVTLQYMPRQYITWWAEVGYRHSDVPYFAGRGGVTPPGGNNGLPQYYTCMYGRDIGNRRIWRRRKQPAEADSAASGSRIFAVAKPSCLLE